ncbi:M48 family metalloprotease [Roseateles sp. UC29_93]|uniref:M48 family metalloprotease n=1 Tax=Roseateles sp. UC29_93 TaxID=3350177 RepID=UPI00366B2C9B
MKRNFPFAVLATAALLTIAGCGTNVVNPVTGRTERSAMSPQQEVATGRQAHQDVLKEYSVVDDPKLQAYVTALGNKLAAQSHRAELEWHFTVLDSPEVNAFALPGGYVYVTRGILAYMENEADLAGVMGHEIGHVTARHGAQRATRQQNAGIGVLAATVLGAVLESRGVSGATDIAGQVSQNAAAGYVASYSREQELQADQLGAEYLARNRYDPKHMVDVIQVLKDQEQFAADQAKAQGKQPQSGNSWLASHPSNEQRLQRIRDEAAQLTGDQPVDENRAAFLQAIDGMVFGDSPSQGLVRGQQFLHPTLDIALTRAHGLGAAERQRDADGDESAARCGADPAAGAGEGRHGARRHPAPLGRGARPHRREDDQRPEGHALQRRAQERAGPARQCRDHADHERQGRGVRAGLCVEGRPVLAGAASRAHAGGGELPRADRR